MVGTTGEDSTAAILADQQELDDGLLTGMPGRQTLPEGETSHIQQFGAIVEYVRAPNPGHLVAHDPPVGAEAIGQMERIGGIVYQVTLPGEPLGGERFGQNRALP